MTDEQMASEWMGEWLHGPRTVPEMEKALVAAMRCARAKGEAEGLERALELLDDPTLSNRERADALRFDYFGAKSRASPSVT